VNCTPVSSVYGSSQALRWASWYTPPKEVKLRVSPSWRGGLQAAESLAALPEALAAGSLPDADAAGSLATAEGAVDAPPPPLHPATIA
jgi:hypothetical protein